MEYSNLCYDEWLKFEFRVLHFLFMPLSSSLLLLIVYLLVDPVWTDHAWVGLLESLGPRRRWAGRRAWRSSFFFRCLASAANTPNLPCSSTPPSRAWRIGRRQCQRSRHKLPAHFLFDKMRHTQAVTSQTSFSLQLQQYKVLWLSIAYPHINFIHLDFGVGLRYTKLSNIAFYWS
jgi:hypothetical protein